MEKRRSIPVREAGKERLRFARKVERRIWRRMKERVEIRGRRVGIVEVGWGEEAEGDWEVIFGVEG